VANTMAALSRSLANMDGAGAKARRALGSAQVTDLIKSLLQVCCSLYCLVHANRLGCRP
jgi:hypothetical protein